MRRFLLLSIALLSVAGLAFGQAGMIGIYADEAGTDCEMDDTAAELITFFAVHTGTAGATACQFSAPQPACMVGATWLSDTPRFPVTIGNSQIGVSVGYGECLVSPISVLAINFFGAGLTTTCCEYAVIPDPASTSGEIEVVDCDENLVFATGLISVVNADASCPCPAAACLSDGDVNNNEGLSPGDAECAFNIFLYGQELPPACDIPNWDCEIIASDVNCNDRVSPGDALEIFNRFLVAGDPADCFAATPSISATAGAGLNDNAFEVPLDRVVKMGDVIRVPVVMEASRGALAFGFEIHFDPASVQYEGMKAASATRDWKALAANEAEPGRVIAGGFDPEGLKVGDVSPDGTIQIAELRFRKLSPDATIGAVEWVEKRLDRQSAGDNPGDTPDRVSKLDLSRPFPNPFRDAVSADVQVPAGETHSVRVSVYDVKGRLVKTLLNETVSSGIRSVTWDRRTAAGQLVSSGIYFMRMEVKGGGFAQTRKLVVLK